MSLDLKYHVSKRILFLMPEGSQFAAFSAKVLETSSSGKYIYLFSSDWTHGKWFDRDALQPYEVLPGQQNMPDEALMAETTKDGCSMYTQEVTIMNLRKLFFRDKQETSVDVVVDTWEVSWYSRYGAYSSDTRRECRFFLSQIAAEEFASALRDAFKLIKHTSGANVYLVKTEV